MAKVCVAGSGKIGTLIASLLANERRYSVDLVDADLKSLTPWKDSKINTDCFDITDQGQFAKYVKKSSPTAVVACLPYFCDLKVAEYAKNLGLHYFDLTEDVSVGEAVRALAQNSRQAFAPKCGLAPGLINIAGNDLIQEFDEVESVKLRVGALPENINNPLQYALTWSTDGLINEYGNTCFGLVGKQKAAASPLEDLEIVTIDGITYEAFNTSGGVGNLVEMYEGKIDILNYKSLRYPGHRDKIDFLMRGLKLNRDRETLKRILENAIPSTTQDVVIIYASVVGKKQGRLVESNFVKKVYPMKLYGKTWSAIQVSTAVTAAAVVDIIVSQPEKYHGYINQEQFSLKDVANNRIGNLLKLRGNIMNGHHEPVAEMA